MASSVPPQPATGLTPLPVRALPLPTRSGPLPVASAPGVVELRPSGEPGGAPPPAPSIPAVGVGVAVPEAPTAQAPTQPGVTFRVVARLSNGERIQVGAHGGEAEAKAEATALMRFLRETGGDWPFLDGGYVRPEAIVSVDVVGA